MKQIIKLFIFALISLSISNCEGQTKPLGEGPLKLDNIKLNFPVSTLLPSKNKSETYKGAFEIPMKDDNSIMITRDSTFSENYSADKKLLGFEYRQINWNNRDVLATLKDAKFQKIDIATDLKDNVKVICAVKDEMSAKEAADFLAVLKKDLGACKTMKSSWDSKLKIHEWVKKDQIIRYISSFNDESNTMKMVVDQDKKTISNAEREPHFVGYFFVIDPVFKKQVGGKLNTGDFVYMTAESE